VKGHSHVPGPELIFCITALKGVLSFDNGQTQAERYLR
jgi:hypothetical protein